MLIAFKLSMPSNNAWNGKWTGEGNLYAVVKNLSSETAAKVLEKENYRYSFGDGWVANVSAEQVDAGRAAKLRKATKGFCGYEWMIDSILSEGRIAA